MNIHVSDAQAAIFFMFSFYIIGYILGKDSGMRKASSASYKRGIHDERKLNSLAVAEKIALAFEEKWMKGELDVKYIDDQSVSFTVLVKYREPKDKA